MRTSFQRLRLVFGVSAAVGALAAAAVPALAQQAPPRPGVVTSPTWLRTPKPGYPAAASAAGVTAGQVTLNCLITPESGMTDCQVVAETPAGYGFAELTIASAAHARITPRIVDGVADPRVTFTVRYEAPPPEPPAPIPPTRWVVGPIAKIVNPVWIQVPQPQFPATAGAAGASTAIVALTCTATVAGTMIDCRVRSETPPGLGFAEAALAAMPGARMQPRTIDGVPADSQQSFNVRFTAPD